MKRNRLLRPSVLDAGSDDEGRPPRGPEPLVPALAVPQAVVDPLDLYLAGVDAELKLAEEQRKAGVAPSERPEIVSETDAGQVDYAEEGGGAAEDDVDGDGPHGIAVLAPVDHSKMSYKPFKRDFYVLGSASKEQGEEEDLRRELELSVQGSSVPAPVISFSMLRLPPQLQRELDSAGFDSPTPVQCQAMPVALAGRDLICLARTGSGKTLSFLVPMIVHIVDQSQMKAGDGPIALVLCPTRELAAQTFAASQRFAFAAFQIRTVCVTGGGAGTWELQCQLKDSVPEVLVSTPGRLIDLLRRKATTLSRVTMVVLDEADKMFDMGFEPQTRAIVTNVRPDAQRLLYSATMGRRVEGFAREMLQDPVRVLQGGAEAGTANPNIRQFVHVLGGGGDFDSERWLWLSRRVDELVASGKLIIFVNSKADTDALAERLRRFFHGRINSGLQCGVEAIHGDKAHSDREAALRAFGRESGSASILVATDLASRGLHLPQVQTVLNFDMPTKIDSYVHRIGRTGRLGQQSVDGQAGSSGNGVAHTLLSASAPRCVSEGLARCLAQAGQAIPEKLRQMAGGNWVGARVDGGFPDAQPPHSQPSTKKSRWDP